MENRRNGATGKLRLKDSGKRGNEDTGKPENRENGEIGNGEDREFGEMGGMRTHSHVIFLSSCCLPAVTSATRNANGAPEITTPRRRPTRLVDARFRYA